jgi:hypothetical protein
MSSRVRDLHNHNRSCLLRQDESTTLVIGTEPNHTCVVVSQITPIEVLDVTTDYDACCDICHVRVTTVEGDSVEGRIKRFMVYPIVSIESLKESHVKIRSENSCDSLTIMKLPNGHFVVPLVEREKWSYISTIVDGFKYSGWIYFEECRFNELS